MDAQDPFSNTGVFQSLKNSAISNNFNKPNEYLNTSDMNPYQNEKLSESMSIFFDFFYFNIFS